jgi:CHRD domain-containing protein
VSVDQNYEMIPNKLLVPTILTLAVSLSIFVTVSTVDQIYAAKYPYRAQLTGETEKPPVTTKATGEASFTTPANGTIKYRVNVTGISNATGAHIHSGGADGQIVADLINTPQSKDKHTSYGMIFRGNITNELLKGPLQGKTLDDLTALMDSGKAYVNVHTTEHQKGEIGGPVANQDKPKASGSGSNSTVGFSTLTE